MFDASLLKSLPFAVALGLVATMLALAAFALRQARRVDGLARELRAERRAREDLARDLSALLDCSREIGARLREQGQRQKTVMERVNEIAEVVDGAPALEHVERLLADGMGVDQIKRVCELSQGEAQLLERWKRHRSAA
ncbi:MAG TPA: DUF2802 domain-containing protein [Gammaproteobacteria bacterium]|nr:DUF2802 domain-containing protein [Gammaproteobacteria bacterium]